MLDDQLPPRPSALPGHLYDKIIGCLKKGPRRGHEERRRLVENLFDDLAIYADVTQCTDKLREFCRKHAALYPGDEIRLLAVPRLGNVRSLKKSYPCIGARVQC